MNSFEKLDFKISNWLLNGVVPNLTDDEMLEFLTEVDTWKFVMGDDFDEFSSDIRSQIVDWFCDNSYYPTLNCILNFK